MENKSILRGSNIYINHDRTAREREIQRKIYQIAREKEAGGDKVRMGFKSLRVNDKQLVWIEGKGLIESFRKPDIFERHDSQFIPAGSQPGRSPGYGSQAQDSGEH